MKSDREIQADVLVEPKWDPRAHGNEIEIRARAPELQAREVMRQIIRALRRHANIEASNIHVTVTGGEVGLEGTIPNPERDLVEEAVRATRGVKEIDDRLRVGRARRRSADLGAG